MNEQKQISATVIQAQLGSWSARSAWFQLAPKDNHATHGGTASGQDVRQPRTHLPNMSARLLTQYGSTSTHSVARGLARQAAAVAAKYAASAAMLAASRPHRL